MKKQNHTGLFMNYADPPGRMTLSVLMAMCAGSRIAWGGGPTKGRLDRGRRSGVGIRDSCSQKESVISELQRLQLWCHGGGDTTTP